MVAPAVRKVHDQVKASRRLDLPIHWTEYNATYMNEPEETDAPLKHFQFDIMGMQAAPRVRTWIVDTTAKGPISVSLPPYALAILEIQP